MIRYRLQCKTGHAFEAWFKSSEDYEKQEKRRQISCPSCGSDHVERAMMAPAVSSKTRKRGATMPVAKAANDGEAGADRHRELLSMMRKLRQEVEQNAENVGRRFADEARKIHNEEAPARGIYGEASAEETRALKEEGIEFYPLPRLPEDQN